MRTRQIVGAAIVAVLALAGSACSSDDKADSTTTTTAAEDSKDAKNDDVTTTTVSDAEFEAKLEKLSTAIDGAGDDLCKLIDAQMAETPPMPTNPKQVEVTVNLYAQLLKAMGGAIKADNAEAAATMEKAATTLVDEAKAADYSVDSLSNSTALSSEEFTKSQQAFSEAAQKCMPETSEVPGAAGDEAPAADPAP